MNKNIYTNQSSVVASIVTKTTLVIVVALLTFVYPVSAAKAQTGAGQSTGAPLSGYCYSNYGYADVDGPITWTADAKGGTGEYTYSWVGTEGLRGTAKSITVAYESVGYKIAGVRISSGGKSINVNCYYPLEVGPVRKVGATIPDKSTLFGLSAVSGSNTNSNQTTSGNLNNQNPQVVIAQGNNPVNVLASNNSNTKSTAGTKNTASTKSTSNSKSESVTKSTVGNMADINKAVTSLRAKGYNVELPDSIGNNSAAAAIFSLKGVPWSSLIIVVIFILAIASVYQIMSKKS